MTEEEINVQVEDNPKTLECKLHPMIYVSWILGVGVARPKNCPKTVTIILRILHFVVCSVIVAYGAIDFFTFGNVFKSDIFRIMYYMNKVVCYLASYYYVCHGITHYTKWPEFVKKMESFDKEIRKETSISDGFVRNVQILAIVTMCFLGPISLVIHALYYYFTLPEDIFASDLLLYYTIAQTMMNSFVFDIIVYIISRRFRDINELIERLDVGIGGTLAALKIRKIRELHNGGCDLVAAVNQLYGIHLLFASANSFTMVVAKLFRIYMSVVERNHEFIMINNIIWMIYAGQFGITCWVCTLASGESSKSGVLLHTIMINAKHSTKFHKLNSFRRITNEEHVRLDLENNEEHTNQNDQTYGLNYYAVESLLRTNFERDCIRNEINDFCMQLNQQRVAFTACDFFELNNSLLTGFIGVITTYLIILVQFYRPENIGKFDRKR